MMVMTRSGNGSRNPSSGTSPVRHCHDEDRSTPPCPLSTSCIRMQTPSAAVKKSAAKSDSPPRGRTMTRSSSRGASRGCSSQAAVYARSDADKVKIAAAAAHYQPFNAKYPDSVREQSVSRGYSDLSPDFSSSRLVCASARDKRVGHNNGSGDVGKSRRGEQISSREPSIEQNARGFQVKLKGQSAALSGASRGCATLQIPSNWNFSKRSQKH